MISGSEYFATINYTRRRTGQKYSKTAPHALFPANYTDRAIDSSISAINCDESKERRPARLLSINVSLRRRLNNANFVSFIVGRWKRQKYHDDQPVEVNSKGKGPDFISDFNSNEFTYIACPKNLLHFHCTSRVSLCYNLNKKGLNKKR